MKNLKLILRSLISNNTCIDGARKKPWYFAVIMFFFSLIVSLVPTFVTYAKTKGDESISTYGYMIQEALVDYKENVLDNGGEIKVVYTEAVGHNELKVAGIPDEYDCKDAKTDKVYFRIFFTDTLENSSQYSEYESASFIVFNTNHFYIYVANPNSGAKIFATICANAWEKFESGYDFKTAVIAESANDTLNNFRSFLRTTYEYNRVRTLWIQTGILAGINFVVSALMGFLVWILTRGKNNCYRSFKFWECEKIAMWGSVSPAILALAFGFLFSNFATVLYSLLIGVRVMWLTSKSLRPDGSGYAAD